MINAVISSSISNSIDQPVATEFTPKLPSTVISPIRKKKKNLAMIGGAIALVVLTIGGAAGLYLTSKSQETRQQASGGLCTKVGECLHGHICVIGANYTVTATGAACGDPANASASAAESTNNTASTSANNVPIAAATFGIFTGKICNNQSADGVLDLYNITIGRAFTKNYSKDISSYSVNVPDGDYFIVFRTTDNKAITTTKTSTDSAIVTLPPNQTLAIDVCSAPVNTADLTDLPFEKVAIP